MISEEMLRSGMEAYEAAFLRSLPDDSECTHAFSAGFERKMRRLCRRVNYQHTYTVLKRVACAILVLFLFGSALLMLRADVRAAALNWFREQTEKVSHYFSNGEPNSAAHKKYEITALPDGYTFFTELEVENDYSILYSSADGKLLYLKCLYDTGSNNVLLDTEKYTISQVTFNEKIADVYISNDPDEGSAIVWTNHDNSVLFVISAHCDLDELIGLALSVQPKESD